MKYLLLIIGFLAAVAGFLIMKNSPLIGFLLMMTGVAVLLIVSISLMHIAGKVKENYFHKGASAAEKFSTQDSAPQENWDVWDKLTEDQEKQK